MVVDFLLNVDSYPGAFPTHLRECHAACSSIIPNIPSFQALAAASTPNLQAAWSKETGRAKADAILASASTPHDRARLLSVRHPMAGLWLSDGVTSWEATFSHETFLTAVRLRLGLPHQGM